MRALWKVGEGREGASLSAILYCGEECSEGVATELTVFCISAASEIAGDWQAPRA